MDFQALIKNDLLIDSHCHLNDKNYDNIRDNVIKNAKEAGVEKVVDIAVNIESSKKSMELADKYSSFIIPTIGIDPEVFIPGSELHDRSFDINKVQEEIDLLICSSSSSISMLGETGIDNYWITKNKELDRQSRGEILEKQKELFKIHLELGEKYNLPVSIHSRNSINICLETIKKASFAQGGSFHSLTPDLDDTEESFYKKINRIHEAGFYIGINGIFTYRSAKMIREVFKKVIRDNRLTSSSSTLEALYSSGFVLETDGPYLIPRRFKAKNNINEPSSIVKVLETLDLE